MNTGLISDVILKSIESAPTLKTALETFVRLIAEDNRSDKFSIISIGRKTIIIRRLHNNSAASIEFYTDLDFFIDLMFIIRRFSAQSWRPRRIASQLGPLLRGIMSICFPTTQLLGNPSYSWIEVPRSFLALQKQSGAALQWSRVPSPVEGTDFIYLLKRALKKHLSEGYPDLEFAARAMHTSVRTLQRNLARVGMSYSRVVEYVRFEIAAEMLRRPNLKIIDIAYSLSYQDPSHFSRAFRRIAGQTPREFRRTHVSKATSPAL